MQAAKNPAKKAPVACYADALRGGFDRVPALFGSVTVVAVFGALTVIGLAWLNAVLHRDHCGSPPDLVQLEVAFSASRFHALMNGNGATCAANAIRSLWCDLLFPLAWAPFLAATFLWAERWRRRTVKGDAREAARDGWRDLILLAPLGAGVLDVCQDVALACAGSALQGGAAAAYSAWVHVGVAVGSTAGLIKWMLLLLSVVGIAREVLSGPRGKYLARLRFSALALALGGFPLLFVSQGQDVLQRLLERQQQLVRGISAVFAVTFSALAIWYCARKLASIRFETAPNDANDATWHEFFGEHIPRMLGIAMLAVSGLAFARAGFALPRFLAVGIGAFFFALLVRHWLPGTLGKLGRVLTFGKLKGLTEVEARAGRLLVAVLSNSLIVWPKVSTDAGTPLDPDQTSFYLRTTAFGCLVVAWIFHLYVYQRREVRAQLSADHQPPRKPVDVVELEDAATELRWPTYGAAATSALFLVLFTAAPVETARSLGALWVLSLVTANAVFLGSVSVWLGARWQLPVVRSAVALALLFSLWNDNHIVRLLSGTGHDIQRPTLQQRLDERLLRQRSSAEPLILVAGAGGGLRAAYWTAMSLAVIQDKAPSFASHVFAVSGVSGGSLGGALFAALVRDAAHAPPLRCARDSGNNASAPRASFTRCVQRFMRDDFLSPVAAKFLAADVLQWFMPVSIPAFDRSTALESSWENSYVAATGHPTFSQGFTQLSRDPNAPALLLNATHVQSGRRSVASSLVRGDDQTEHRIVLDASDLIDELGADMRLSTAVHNSARFPYVSPAGRLRSARDAEFGHVVDGGYFENSGLATLHELYDLIRATHPEIRPVILYLCNDPSTCARAAQVTQAEHEPSTIGDEWLSPVRALLHTRDARGSLSQASMQNVAKHDFLQLNVCATAPKNVVDASTTLTGAAQGQRDTAKERIVSPPLGWLLSQLSRNWMDVALRGANPKPSGDCYEQNAAVLARIAEMLKSEHE